MEQEPNERIDATCYTGPKGQSIIIRFINSVQLARLRVVIRNSTGKTLERGWVDETSSMPFRYVSRIPPSQSPFVCRQRLEWRKALDTVAWGGTVERA